MAEPKSSGEPRSVDTDLVEYLIIAVPDLGSVAALASPLVGLVTGGTLRVLDLVVIETADDGSITVIEPEAVEGVAALVDTVGIVEGMLSEHDLMLASMAIRPGTAALILVVEDQWAEPLAEAARRAGGGVIAGERIPRQQVETALSGTPPG
jgi:Family of unknown function (DUF6325)